MILAAAHSAPLDIKATATDTKEGDTCEEAFESVGEIKDDDETRIPWL